jgi:hypothetical protein
MTEAVFCTIQAWAWPGFRFTDQSAQGKLDQSEAYACDHGLRLC